MKRKTGAAFSSYMEGVKDHPLLVTGSLVPPILEDRKTQTRRLPSMLNSLVDGAPCSKKLWRQLDFALAYCDSGPSPAGNKGPYLKVPTFDGETIHRVYPRYQAGDRLWVRETFARVHSAFLEKLDPDPDGGGFFNVYAADGIPVPSLRDFGVAWTPSIHMPRWASRITLEITKVRVERLQDISKEDALAEGVWPNEQPPKIFKRTYGNCMPIHLFGGLWDSCYAKRGFGWEANPHVWVLEFRRIMQGEQAHPAASTSETPSAPSPSSFPAETKGKS